MYEDCVERFWTYVEVGPQDQCWRWLGQMSAYGVFSIKGKKKQAHRMSWEIANGREIPKGERCHQYVIMHSCDNRACVNPHHLSLGSQKDNVRDMIMKGRKSKTGPKGREHWSARFTEEQVRSIRMDTRNHSEIARELGTSAAEIHYIRRCGWRHVETPAVLYDNGKSRAGAVNANSRLSESSILAIRADSRKPGKIAADYGITPDYVTKIRKLKAWAHV